jgi:hypothetical protein
MRIQKSDLCVTASTLENRANANKNGGRRVDEDFAVLWRVFDYGRSVGVTATPHARPNPLMVFIGGPLIGAHLFLGAE